MELWSDGKTRKNASGSSLIFLIILISNNMHLTFFQYSSTPFLQYSIYNEPVSLGGNE